MRNKIITISRELGSGGKYIGELVSKKLGIPFYDKEIMEKVAEETGFVDQFIERISEYAPSKNIYAYAFVGRSASGESIEDYINNIQRKIILDIAEKSPCVIVGRSADYILKDKHDTLNVFICGDIEEKKKRLSSLRGITEEEAEKLMKETDKKRSINYKYYTGQTWGNIKNYTMVLNSTKIGVEKCADIIVSTYLS